MQRTWLPNLVEAEIEPLDEEKTTREDVDKRCRLNFHNIHIYDFPKKTQATHLSIITPKYITWCGGFSDTVLCNQSRFLSVYEVFRDDTRGSILCATCWIVCSHILCIVFCMVREIGICSSTVYMTVEYSRSTSCFQGGTCYGLHLMSGYFFVVCSIGIYVYERIV